jgi:hypothetical protein
VKRREKYSWSSTCSSEYLETQMDGQIGKIERQAVR